MHELTEGLTRVEVIADDFVVFGFGDTLAEASMKRYEERCVKLNIGKMKLRVMEVPFVGHRATDKGLCVDPRKVRAIIEMPRQTDVDYSVC